MTEASAVGAAVRQVIDNAWLVPPPLETFASEPERTPSAIISRLPIYCHGMARAEAEFPKPPGGYPTRTVALLRARNPDRELGELFATIVEAKSDASPDPVFLYCDINGVARVLADAQHDRNGIASLFAGDRWLLSRFWPAAKHWDADRAATDLLCRQGEIGLIRIPPGFEQPIIAESDVEIAAQLSINRMAAQLLRQGANPAEAIAICRSSPAGHTLQSKTIAAIVAGAQSRQMRGRING